MNIIVCTKQVIDPEAPPSAFKVDTVTKVMVLSPDIAPVLDPYSEYALEAALRLKDAYGGRVTAISLGVDLVRDVAKKPLSMGADELILLEDEAFAGGDSWSTANALARAIRQVGDYDLILCGRQASDWDAGQVGPGIAEILGVPSVTVAKKIEANDGKVRVERVTDDGYEIIEVPLPALITVSNELGEARYPTIKGIMAAKRIEPVVWKLADIDLDAGQAGAAGRRVRLRKLFQPVHEAKCEVVGGESPEESGVNLALKLREAKLL